MRRVSTWLLMVPLFCMLSSSFADDHKASKTTTQPSATKPGLDGFDDFVAQALKDWEGSGRSRCGGAGRQSNSAEGIRLPVHRSARGIPVQG
jgi:hypothetical protein